MNNRKLWNLRPTGADEKLMRQLMKKLNISLPSVIRLAIKEAAEKRGVA